MCGVWCEEVRSDVWCEEGCVEVMCVVRSDVWR